MENIRTMLKHEAKGDILEAKKKRKKRSKKAAWGYFVNPDAGNVEYNNDFFNMAAGADGASSLGTSEGGGTSGGEGMGESMNIGTATEASIYDAISNCTTMKQVRELLGNWDIELRGPRGGDIYLFKTFSKSRTLRIPSNIIDEFSSEDIANIVLDLVKHTKENAFNAKSSLLEEKHPYLTLDSTEEIDFEVDIEDYPVGGRDYYDGEYEKYINATVTHTLETTVRDLIDFFFDEELFTEQQLAAIDKLHEDDQYQFILDYYYDDMLEDNLEYIQDKWQSKADREAWDYFDPSLYENKKKETTMINNKRSLIEAVEESSKIIEEGTPAITGIANWADAEEIKRGEARKQAIKDRVAKWKKEQNHKEALLNTEEDRLDIKQVLDTEGAKKLHLSESLFEMVGDSTSEDDFDAKYDDRKEAARKRFAKAKDDEDADRDYRKKKGLTEDSQESDLGIIYRYGQSDDMAEDMEFLHSCHLKVEQIGEERDEKVFMITGSPAAFAKAKDSGFFTDVQGDFFTLTRKRVIEEQEQIGDSLTEEMSEEDAKDTEILWNILDKLSRNSETSFTAKEQAVLDKYDLHRDGGWADLWIQHDDKGTGLLTSSSFGRRNKGKINLADRARKMAKRNGSEAAYTARDAEYDMGVKYNDMETYLRGRKDVTDRQKEIDDELEAKIAYLRKRAASDKADAADTEEYYQKRIDALLKRSKTESMKRRAKHIEDKEANRKMREDAEQMHELETTPNPPAFPEGTAVAAILNTLIISEWEAIQDYNDAVATFEAEGLDDNMLNVFKDIVNEEHVHVGQLQELLKIVSPNAASIKAGEKEGEGQLEEPGTVPVEESFDQKYVLYNTETNDYVDITSNIIEGDLRMISNIYRAGKFDKIAAEELAKDANKILKELDHQPAIIVSEYAMEDLQESIKLNDKIYVEDIDDSTPVMPTMFDYVIDALGIETYTDPAAIDEIVAVLKPYEDKLRSGEYMILASDNFDAGFDGDEAFELFVDEFDDVGHGVVVYKNKYKVKSVFTDAERLDEAIPADLAQAYNAADKAEDRPSRLTQKDKNMIDYAAAEYEEVAKDTAKAIIKSGTRDNDIVAIVNGRAIEFVSGKPVTSYKSYQPLYKTKSGKHVYNTKYMPVEAILEIASKIYKRTEPKIPDEKLARREADTGLRNTGVHDSFRSQEDAKHYLGMVDIWKRKLAKLEQEWADGTISRVDYERAKDECQDYIDYYTALVAKTQGRYADSRRNQLDYMSEKDIQARIKRFKDLKDEAESLDSSIRYYARKIELNPRHAQNKEQLSKLNAELKRIQDDIASIEQKIAADKDWEDDYNVRQLGDNEQRLADIQSELDEILNR